MVIALRHHADAFYQTIRAFNLAEKYQIPVILLSDQYLGDASATVEPFDVSQISLELFRQRSTKRRRNTCVTGSPKTAYRPACCPARRRTS